MWLTIRILERVLRLINLFFLINTTASIRKCLVKLMGLTNRQSNKKFTPEWAKTIQVLITLIVIIDCKLFLSMKPWTYLNQGCLAPHWRPEMPTKSLQALIFPIEIYNWRSLIWRLLRQRRRWMTGMQIVLELNTINTSGRKKCCNK